MSGAASSFDRDQFVAACRAALAETTPQRAVCEVIAGAVASPRALVAALGEPERAGVQTLHRSDELTVLNVIWAPRMTLMPHNHEMWAVIGIYSGREDNIFWRRIPDAPGRIEAAGAKSLSERDAVPLGRDIIHSVLNPIPRLTAALHVYGGDFFAQPRSEWDPETLCEGAFDVDKTLRLFAESNTLPRK